MTVKMRNKVSTPTDLAGATVQRSARSRTENIKKAGAAAQPAESTPSRTLRLLSVRDAAVFAKVSQQTIRRAIKAGHLKTYRAGRQIRIDEADLVEYLSCCSDR